MGYLVHPEQIKLVFFDIDETLYVKNKALVPPSVYTALRQLKQRGIAIGIATGRTRGIFPPVINALIEQVGIETMVTINGQHNSHQGVLIERHPIERSRIEQVIAFLEQQRITYGFVSHEGLAVSDNSAIMQRALSPISTRYVIDPDYYQKHEIYQMLAFYSAQDEALIQGSGILGDDLKTLRWHADCVDLLDKTGSKARGIDTIARHLGYCPSNVMAFGDGINDMEMLAHVGLGVAMGNAIDELKHIAHYVTSDIEDDGIFNALAHFGLVTQD